MPEVKYTITVDESDAVDSFKNVGKQIVDVSEKGKSALGNLGGQADQTAKQFQSMAQESARAQQHVGEAAKESFFQALLGAQFLIATFEKLIETTKEWTVESALGAARTEVLATSISSLARVNHLSAATMFEQEARIKALGVTTKEARQTLAQFVQAQLDVTQAAKLARVAQDAAVI